jgi:hypothetical protein
MLLTQEDSSFCRNAWPSGRHSSSERKTPTRRCRRRHVELDFSPLRVSASTAGCSGSTSTPRTLRSRTISELKGFSGVDDRLLGRRDGPAQRLVLVKPARTGNATAACSGRTTPTWGDVVYARRPEIARRGLVPGPPNLRHRLRPLSSSTIHSVRLVRPAHIPIVTMVVRPCEIVKFA